MQRPGFWDDSEEAARVSAEHARLTKRLERYVAERKFAMPVLRYNREQATATFNVHDTPTTFYVDKDGNIQYQVVGVEPHGDAVERVTWYIEQLKGR